MEAATMLFYVTVTVGVLLLIVSIYSNLHQR